MDLGFGAGNQRVGDATAALILQGARAQERAVSEQLDQYDAVLCTLQNDIGSNRSSNNTNDFDDGDDDGTLLQQLRARRLLQLQQAAASRRRFLATEGHGRYDDLSCIGGGQTRDVAKAFFAAAKASERLVVHFYRPSTELCQVFHKHLARLAPKHVETRFVQINVQDCDTVTETGASYLVERLQIRVMPTLLLVRNRQVVHQIRGFDELLRLENTITTTTRGKNFFRTQTLARVLASHNMVHLSPSSLDDENGDNDYDDEDGDYDKDEPRHSSFSRGGVNTKSGRRSMYNDDEEHEEY